MGCLCGEIDSLVPKEEALVEFHLTDEGRCRESTYCSLRKFTPKNVCPLHLYTLIGEMLIDLEGIHVWNDVMVNHSVRETRRSKREKGRQYTHILLTMNDYRESREINASPIRNL
jgi:hypothetical protein